MAGVKYYIRFVDPEGTYFGKSSYRPSEGWIDALSFRWSSREHKKDGYVDIAGMGAPVVQLYRALLDGRSIDSVVVEIHVGGIRYRSELSEVRIDDFYNHGSGADYFCTIMFSYKERKDGHVAPPKVRPR